MNELWGWVDTDLAGDTHTLRSHTGYVLMMNDGTISWENRRQDNVSLSTSETEFVAANQADQEVLHLYETLRDFGYQQSATTTGELENPVRREFSRRHIDIRRYFVCVRLFTMLYYSPPCTMWKYRH